MLGILVPKAKRSYTDSFYRSSPAGNVSLHTHEPTGFPTL